MGQAKLDKAEPLLVAGYEGLDQKKETIHLSLRTLRLTQALDRLIELYNVLEQPKLVEKYTAKRNRLDPLP